MSASKVPTKIHHPVLLLDMSGFLQLGSLVFRYPCPPRCPEIPEDSRWSKSRSESGFRGGRSKADQKHANSYTFDLLSGTSPPKPTFGPTFDLLEMSGISGLLGGQGQHNSSALTISGRMVLHRQLHRIAVSFFVFRFHFATYTLQHCAICGVPVTRLQLNTGAMQLW